MFIDASAVIAILNREAGFERVEARIDQATDGVTFSPMVRFEAVLTRFRIVQSDDDIDLAASQRRQLGQLGQRRELHSHAGMFLNDVA